VSVLDSSVSECGSVVGFREHSNEPLSFIEVGEFLDKLRKYQLFKENSAPWS
jgi:hypothetical protein